MGADQVGDPRHGRTADEGVPQDGRHTAADRDPADVRDLVADR
jgi:hypothetical protein